MRRRDFITRAAIAAGSIGMEIGCDREGSKK